jgi:hypothetical protein
MAALLGIADWPVSGFEQAMAAYHPNDFTAAIQDSADERGRQFFLKADVSSAVPLMSDPDHSGHSKCHVACKGLLPLCQSCRWSTA